MLVYDHVNVNGNEARYTIIYRSYLELIFNMFAVLGRSARPYQ